MGRVDHLWVVPVNSAGSTWEAGCATLGRVTDDAADEPAAPTVTRAKAAVTSTTCWPRRRAGADIGIRRVNKPADAHRPVP